MDYSGDSGIAAITVAGDGTSHIVYDYWDNEEDPSEGVAVAVCNGTGCSTSRIHSGYGSLGAVTTIGGDGNPVIVYEDGGNSWLGIPDSVHYYSSGTDTVVSSAGSTDTYSRDVAIGSDGFATVVFSTMGGGADVIHCTNLSCSANSGAAISFLGPYTPSISVVVGADGTPIVQAGTIEEGGSATDIDFISCTTSNCSSYGDELVPGSAWDAHVVSLALGLDGFPRMITQCSDAMVYQVRRFQFRVQGNSFIFVGSDPALVSANKYFADDGNGHPPNPSGGAFSVVSDDPNDTSTSGPSPLPWVSVNTPDQSIDNLDRTLTFKYALSADSFASQTMRVTARKFTYLTGDNPTDTCSLGYGTDRTYTYTVYTHPDHTAIPGGGLLEGTLVTESFQPDPTPCPGEHSDGALNSNDQFTDHVAACSNQPLTCSGSATQSFSVGGFSVRTNTLTWSSSGISVANNGPKPMRLTVASGLLLLNLITVPHLTALQDGTKRVDPSLEQKVKRLELLDESLIDGIAKLTRLPIGLHIGVEAILGDTVADSIARNVRFSVDLRDKTIREILDTLCQSDARYVWSTDGATINVYPRAVAGDPSYLLNRQIKRITLTNIPNPEQALAPLDRQLPPPREQLGYSRVGGDSTYAEPWTVVFENLTVRQFINRIAEHMGPHSSWFWRGTKHERFFTFLKGGVHTEAKARKSYVGGGYATTMREAAKPYF